MKPKLLAQKSQGCSWWYKFSSITLLLYALIYFHPLCITSYGKYWGQGGYMLVRRNVNMCGIATEAAAPIVSLNAPSSWDISPSSTAVIVCSLKCTCCVCYSLYIACISNLSAADPQRPTPLHASSILIACWGVKYVYSYPALCTYMHVMVITSDVGNHYSLAYFSRASRPHFRSRKIQLARETIKYRL